MSKAFAFAGARLGYMAGAPDIIAAVQVVRLPYHLSAVTQAVARVALAHAHELLAKVEAIRIDRDEITQWLRDQGLVVPDSDANFVLVGRFADRHAVWRGCSTAASSSGRPDPRATYGSQSGGRMRWPRSVLPLWR